MASIFHNQIILVTRHSEPIFWLEGKQILNPIHEKELQKRILAHQARIGVIGLGYMGLPLVIRLVHKGFSVLGFDIARQKVEALNAWQS
jgi:phosphoglycerate dehydrogenase-like enzyme